MSAALSHSNNVSPPPATTAVLAIESLFVTLGTGPRSINAVDGVTLTLEPGQTLGLVGESGCGKSTLARAVVGLVRPSAGRVLVGGKDIHQARRGELASIRRRVQMIFQDPAGSLNPRMTVGQAVAEPLIIHGLPWKDEVPALIERCGLSRDVMSRYPHQFSGGQRQRIAIARALALKPQLVVCDEPTSALDVSMQAQILNLLTSLQASHRLAYLFITHDMGVVAHMADHIAVMQRGKVVEAGPTAQVLTHPIHELTKRLAAHHLATPPAILPSLSPFGNTANLPGSP